MTGSPPTHVPLAIAAPLLQPDPLPRAPPVTSPALPDRALEPDVVIYYNPECGTSRNVLAMIRASGIEPHVVEYLKTPPSRAMLAWLVTRAGVPARDMLREKHPLHAELGLADPALDDPRLLDAMAAHPALINRPIVVSPRGVRLCRPAERVADLLPAR